MIYNRKYGDDPLIIDFANNTIKGQLKSYTLKIRDFTMQKASYFPNILFTGDLNQAKIRIPSILKGFEFTHSLYGTLPWKDLLEPTINLAKNGFIISQELSLQSLKSDDQFYGKRIYAGDVMKLPVLAKTLELVASKGTIGNIKLLKS